MASGTRGPRGPYRTGIKTREQIVLAAAKTFGEKGYRAASLRQIAADVGLSPAALLRHFERKEDLLAAVLKWWEDETAHRENPDLQGLRAIDQLRTSMAYHLEHRGLLELFITLTAEAAANPEHPARDFVRRRYAQVVRTKTDQLLQAVQTGEIPPLTEADAESDIRALLAVMDGLELQWLLDPNMDLVGTFNRYLDHALACWRAGTRPMP
ncbi:MULTISPECIES: TetR/AcrR family transcriptional regulator [Streptomyces]|uniref:TetR/AcrR family transcriptional regulator n=1 Tax=Streptomyces doebereineriae TaxID=3075528 RepID=A0ABU2VH08_9ACTN|nr:MULTISPECIES: TetR/AcrR family transcriptional regulator [unclassified Streptomyces]MCX4765939.1 TetR/AcrR family transcriptional regulator [Streptomyces sp. NBC_01275]MDT0484396.1 TetR/AcrR family transcriptional regulator [Streptomyces sp. DSM 41640]